MSLHKLNAGKMTIEALLALGRTLDYCAQAEHPVEDRPNGATVDVAWLRDEEVRYPLMIFEVESAAANTMANNPTKVFGQPARRYERPLFYFHIVLDSGSQTSRIESLIGVFGTHNYRVYEFGKSSAGELIRDILSQHRRITQLLPIFPFLDTLHANSALPVDIGEIVAHAIDIGLRADYLEVLAELHLKHPGSGYQRIWVEVLRKFVVRRPPHLDGGYHTYIGTQWAVPLTIGVLCNTEFYSDNEAVVHLRAWQESWHLSQIGPHFGLSYDYDKFLIGMAGPLLALVAALMIDAPRSIEYVSEQSGILLEGMLKDTRPQFAVFTAIWNLHIVAASGNEDRFMAAIQNIARFGRISVESVLDPPSFCGAEEEPIWPEGPQPHFTSIAQFRQAIREKTEFLIAGTTSLDVAMRALVTEDEPFEWAPVLVGLLARSSLGTV